MEIVHLKAAMDAIQPSERASRPLVGAALGGVELGEAPPTLPPRSRVGRLKSAAASARLRVAVVAGAPPRAANVGGAEGARRSRASYLTPWRGCAPPARPAVGLLLERRRLAEIVERGTFVPQSNCA